MPSNTVHVAAAAVIYLGILYSLGAWAWLVYLPVVLAWSLLPDADSPISSAASFVKQFCLFGFLLGSVAFYFWGNVYVGVFAAFNLFMLIGQVTSSHRGWWHTVSVGIILSLPLLYVSWQCVAAALFGYCSHLLIDGELKFRPRAVM